MQRETPRGLGSGFHRRQWIGQQQVARLRWHRRREAVNTGIFLLFPSLFFLSHLISSSLSQSVFSSSSFPARGLLFDFLSVSSILFFTDLPSFFSYLFPLLGRGMREGDAAVRSTARWKRRGMAGLLKLDRARARFVDGSEIVNW